MAAKIRKGDKVVVISGRDKGRSEQKSRNVRNGASHMGFSNPEPAARVGLFSGIAP